MSFSLDKEKDLTQIFNMVNGRRWEKVFLKTPRTIESVILPQDKTDMIIQDVKKFFKREHWYQDRGYPIEEGIYCMDPWVRKDLLCICFGRTIENEYMCG